MVEKNTQAVDPKEFETRKNDKNALAVYGELPVANSGTESYEWNLLLLQISKSVQTDPSLEKYSYAYGGPIFGYGSNYTSGYMQVYIDFERAEKLNQDDLEYIHEIFEKHANKNGVKNLPLVIACEYMGQADTAVATVNPIDFNTKTRPIIGGVEIATPLDYPYYSRETIGYPVININNSSSTKGFVTAAHFLPEDGTGKSLYQPAYYHNAALDNPNLTATNAVNDISSMIDAIYIQYSGTNKNVEPYIHVGDDLYF
jgi:hypothetical protein